MLVKMLILETERLLLREFVPEDVDALAAVLSDPETMRYYPAVLDRAGVVAWIERNRRRYADDGHGLWAMVLKVLRRGDRGLRLDPTESGRSGRNRSRISRAP
jgi:ribosomal-protein-alanine N-acetyltransferase